MGGSVWKSVVAGALLLACGAEEAPVVHDEDPLPVTGDASVASDAGVPGDAAEAAADAGVDASMALPCDDSMLAAVGLVGAAGCDGALSYAGYANRGESEADNRVPDFSFAGYGGGGVALPDDVPTVETVSPGPGDDGQRIRDAIARAASRAADARGFHGAVLLTRGRYEIAESIEVTDPGVVLRGEGQSEGRTVLVATGPKPYDLVRFLGAGGVAESESSTSITSERVPVGATSFEVEDTSAFGVGATVAVMRTPNDTWLEAVELDQAGWDTDSSIIAHPRVITAVRGNLIEVDVPLVDGLSAALGGGELVLLGADARLRKVGVEDLRIETEWMSASSDAAALALENVADGWVRRVTVKGFDGSAVSVRGASESITIEDSASLSSSDAFVIEGGHRVLVQRVYAVEAEHAFRVGAQVVGPNVFLDSLSVAGLYDDGPAGGWATGVLFDNVRTDSLGVGNEQAGWSGAQIMFYNVDARLTVDAPAHAMNWAVGCTGERGDSDEPGMWESFGTPIRPRSLFIEQLTERLGEGAMREVSLAEQEAGRIWDVLSRWAGEGSLRSYLPQ